MSMRGQSSSPFSYRRASSPFSLLSSTSLFMNTNGRFVPRSCSTSGSLFYGSVNGYGARSTTLNRNWSNSMYAAARGYSGRSQVRFHASEELSGEPLDVPRSSGDSISIIIRFRPMNDGKYQRGDEITWCPDGDKIVRREYNPTTAYAFDKVFGPNATSEEVYEVAARPVVRTAMEGVNVFASNASTVFAYGVTSSGKTHTMHVIGKLSEGKASHIPHRDSKLTRLLQSSLNGRGHVSLICTMTPAFSSMEETHNTLKYTSRAKRVEIYASRNKIVDEKSLIKKYQHEISRLKQELDQLRRGMLAGISHEEIMSLRQ
ncbi:hypothetical protein Ancab_005712 [Ancistrocladus abbreviatus]